MESLTELRGLNEVTIWSIASEVRDSQRVGNFQELMAGMEANPYAGKDLESFGLAILETRDILDELKSDLIAVDYKLYEDLMDNIEARQLTFSILKDSELGSFSKQKLTDLYQAYEDLIKSLQLCKDRVQEKTKDTQA